MWGGCVFLWVEVLKWVKTSYKVDWLSAQRISWSSQSCRAGRWAVCCWCCSSVQPGQCAESAGRCPISHAVRSLYSPPLQSLLCLSAKLGAGFFITILVSNARMYCLHISSFYKDTHVGTHRKLLTQEWTCVMRHVKYLMELKDVTVLNDHMGM